VLEGARERNRERGREGIKERGKCGDGKREKWKTDGRGIRRERGQAMRK